MGLAPSRSDQDRARIASAVSATVSAFVVFVAGGTLVGVLWWDEKQASVAELAPVVQTVTDPVATEVPEVLEPPPEVEEPAVVAAPTPTQVRKKSPALPAPEEAPAATAAPSGGKGTVMVIGDAQRIRLVGVGGSFGPGSVPSGDYTVIATFPDEEPMAAGSARIFPDTVIRVICSAEHGRCVQR